MSTSRLPSVDAAAPEADSLSSDASRKNFSVPPVVSMAFRPDSHCFGPNCVSGRPAFGERFAAPGRGETNRRRRSRLIRVQRIPSCTG